MRRERKASRERAKGEREKEKLGEREGERERQRGREMCDYVKFRVHVIILKYKKILIDTLEMFV